MDLATLIEKMISRLDERQCDLVLPPFMRDRLRRQFGYFHLQALCDFDRRHDPKVIAMHWKMLKQNPHARFIIERQASEARTWPIIANFVGDTEVYRSETPRPQLSSEEPVRDFFLSLIKRVPIHPDAALVALGLRYLAAETKLRPVDRDRNSIRSVWKMIWPELNRLGLLAAVRDDAVLKTRVQNFVANGYYFQRTGGGGITHKLEKGVGRPHPDHDYSGRRGVDFRNSGLGELNQCPPTPRGLGRPKI